MTKTKVVVPRSVSIRFLAAASFLAFAAAPAFAFETGAANAPAAHHHARSCGDAMPGYVRCHAWLRVNPSGSVTPFATTPQGLNPADLVSAYRLPATGGATQTIAIVDAMDDPTAESDLARYRSQFGLPTCTTANGCFRKVNQNGATSPLPAADAGWAGEISLDLDMASAICPSCKILLVEASSATIANLGAAVNRAALLGATVISNSYGGGESTGDPTTTSQFFNHPGILITASTGDGGFGVEYPAAATTVMAVGGTRLVRSTTTRGWTETAWSGAGSGCSAVANKPIWQTDTGCSRRAVADVSAVADPDTGVSVFQTTVSAGQASGWQVYGGTSVAAPVVASIFALTGHGTATPLYPYANTAQFFDATGGSNGTCSPSYLCTAVAGYDGPTGIGTPDGSAMTGSALPRVNRFSISARPTALSIAAGAIRSAITAATVPEAAPTVTRSGWATPAGATRISPPSATSIQSGAGGTCATSTQLLRSPRFGSGATGWTTRRADTLAQTVAIPAAACSATFTFRLKVTTAKPTASAAFDQLTVTANGTTLGTFSNLNRGPTYVQRSFDLTPFRGQPVTIELTAAEDPSLQMSFFVDDAAVTVVQ